MHGNTTAAWLGTAVLLSVAGAVLGYATAWFVWQFIYGIGSRVVSDQEHYELLSVVPGWGALAGACSGLAVCCLPSGRRMSSFATVHGLSALCGMYAGSSGWRAGLYGYFGVHV